MRSGNPAGAVNVTCAGVARCNQKKKHNTRARTELERDNQQGYGHLFQLPLPIYSRVSCWRGFINHKKRRKNNAARWWLSLGHGQGAPVWTLLPCHDIIIGVKCFQEKTRPCFYYLNYTALKDDLNLFYFFVFSSKGVASTRRASNSPAEQQTLSIQISRPIYFFGLFFLIRNSKKQKKIFGMSVQLPSRNNKIKKLGLNNKNVSTKFPRGFFFYILKCCLNIR